MAQQAIRIEENEVERASASANEPDWLKRYRRDSLNSFNVLPVEKSSLYTKHAIDLERDLAPLPGVLKLEEKTIEGSYPISEIASGVETGYYFIQTGREVIASRNIVELESKGILFCDLHEALEKHESILKSIFAKKAIGIDEDKFAALNGALFSTGWLVHVPKNITFNAPLRLRFYLDSTKPHFSQIWVNAEENSQISLLTESYGGGPNGVASEISEIYLGENSSVNFSNIQNYSESTVALSNRKALCKKDARVSWTLGHFGGKLERSRLESIFEEDGASAEDTEVVFGDGTQKYDLVSDLTHVGKHTKGRIITNSVLKEKARSIFKGMIRIGNEAKNASAYLAGHAILLSPEAKADAIPGLEILTNEVKATHSASVAQIDQEQIFYMMTRGLSEDEARKFIVLGFLEPAIARIGSEELRDTIRDLVEAKWYGKAGLLKKQKHEVLFEEQEQTQAQRDIFEGHYKYR